VDAFAGCWKQFGGQAGVCADVGHNVVPAEQFSYDLKMLKRATLVGETTRGGAHAGVFHRIDDHFGIGIPEERSINPYGTTVWEGVGIQPDIKVPAAAALKTALRQAQSQIQKNKISLQHD
jgi:C-terminal processing protease CtpA/Prc